MKTEDLFPDHDHIWIIADYCDRVTKRRKKLFDRDERMRSRMWGTHHKPEKTFESEASAWQFAVQRAEGNVRAAEKHLVATRARLAKCQKRLRACGELRD